jgi:hypothetical protein
MVVDDEFEEGEVSAAKWKVVWAHWCRAKPSWVLSEKARSILE